MRQGLDLLARAGAAGVPLDRLVEALAAGTAGATSRLRRHVMRLAKHGLATIAAGDGSRSEPG
jgi:hypothetical protein